MRGLAFVLALGLACASAQTASPVRQAAASPQQQVAMEADARQAKKGRSDFRIVEDDESRPVEIEHRCEEIYDPGGKLHARYNYVVYHFAATGGFFYARAYLDEIGTVSVYGPFEGRNYAAPGSRIDGPLDNAMLAYLKRRFVLIQRLGGEGYATVWQKAAR